MKALGIILAGGNSKGMRELSKRRAAAAMPVAGSYRSIDFALSSMSNSRIENVAVITQYNSRSLNEHLSSSKWWDFGRKQGGLHVITPTITPESSDWFKGTADSLYSNIDYLKNSHEPYVVLTGGDCVYKLDYNKVLEYHIEKGADITVVCKELPQGEDVRRFGVVVAAPDGQITEFHEKPEQADSPLISCGIYVVRRRLLIDILERCAKESWVDFVRDVLVRGLKERRIYSYMLNTYWSNIATVESYYRTNMDFLDPKVRGFFFGEYPSIQTKEDDLPSARINSGAVVRNSLISSGSVVNGRVEDSVLFKKSHIGKNCKIKNSIILNDVYIGDDCDIEYCIVESRGTIKSGSCYRGSPDDIKIVDEHYKRYDL